MAPRFSRYEGLRGSMAVSRTAMAQTPI
jgi:hypothetical protein